jgi:Fic family protein
MTTKIQNDFKEEEKIKDQKVEELLQKGDRKGALKLLRGHVEEGEDLKSDLNDIDSLKRRSKQISSEIDKRTTQSQQITSTVPSFQQKTLHVKKKERLVTGLKMMQHCSIKYDYNEKITSLKVKDANGNLVKVNKEGTYGNVDYADIVVYGGDEEVDVTITVEL